MYKMKKRNLIILIVCICLVSVVFSKAWAFGKKEYHIEAGHEALINHPEFVSIEYINTNEHDMGVYYIVNLTDGRKIEFNYIDTNTGGGIFGGVEAIGNYRFFGVSAYKNDNPQYWEDFFGKYYKHYGNYASFFDSYSQEWRQMYNGLVISFYNLSMLLGIKIETMTDAINNYDKIVQLAQILAREQYLTKIKEIPHHGNFDVLFDTEVQNRLPQHFVNSENRKGFVYVVMIENYGDWEWDEKIPADKLKKYLGLE